VEKVEKLPQKLLLPEKKAPTKPTSARKGSKKGKGDDDEEEGEDAFSQLVKKKWVPLKAVAVQGNNLVLTDKKNKKTNVNLTKGFTAVEKNDEEGKCEIKLVGKKPVQIRITDAEAGEDIFSKIDAKIPKPKGKGGKASTAKGGKATPAKTPAKGGKGGKTEEPEEGSGEKKTKRW
jgi:hypothetical protein